MRIQAFPAVALLVLASESSIGVNGYNIIPRSMTRAVQHAHRVAVKHSAGLANDLRVAFKGVLATRDLDDAPKTKNAVYCKTSNFIGGEAQAANGGNVGQIPSVNGSTSVGGSSYVSGSLSSSTRGRTTSAKSPVTTTPASDPVAQPSPAPTSVNGQESPWGLFESHEGANFLDGFSFFTFDDPTNGIVDYVSREDAQNSGLLQVTNEGVTMRVETTPVVENVRKSVRITTDSQFTGGLVLMDASHMATGCGTWPAFWTNGPNWPTGGEIDIVEGVSDNTHNQATIHTDPGCRLPSDDSREIGISGTVVGGTDCAAASTGNQGCGVRQEEGNSFGKPFNDNQGGVFGMKWDDTGISTYFVPSRCDSGRYHFWHTDSGHLGITSCAMGLQTSVRSWQFFRDHSVIINTTLCGDWAAGIWNASGGVPGQEQSCAAKTGYDTCEAFVRANGAAMSELIGR